MATTLMKLMMVLCKSHNTTATQIPTWVESSPTFDAHTPLPDMNSQGLVCMVSIFFCVSFELAFVYIAIL